MTKMNKWTPTTNLLELRRLGKTVEELGELVAALGRTVCQGLEGVDPASGESNIDRITKESADVLAQIGCNVKAFQLDKDRMDWRVADKTDQMSQWEALFGDGTLPTYTDELELRYAEACEERDHLRSILAVMPAATTTTTEAGGLEK